MLPTPRHARLLLPDAGREATLGAATNYRRLRPVRERTVRRGLGALARRGAPLSPTVLQIDVPTAQGGVAHTLPTRAIAATLGQRELHASVGVRPGANGKATLQLVHPDGRPAGYAKLGWNDTTDGYVRTEADALSALSLVDGRVRAPRVLAAFEYAEHPVLVTEPLPEDVRALRGGVAGPTPAELYALCPVIRTDLPAATHHLEALRDRLDALAGPLVARTAARGLHLVDTVAAVRTELPVAARWHGDFTPWNCARDGSGALWTWDWESSEADAVAGLDALHWAFSERRERTHDLADITIADCIADAAQHLVAAGVPRDHWRTIAQVYVATVIDRACGLALASGGWGRVWIQPQQLASLADQASA